MIKTIKEMVYEPKISKFLAQQMEYTATIFGVIYIISLIIGFFTPISYVYPYILGILASSLYYESGIILEDRENINSSFIWFINSMIILLIIFK